MFNFRKRKTIAKGLKLNISKSGVGLTGGVKGLGLSVGSKGLFLNTSIPGTGLYKRKKLSFENHNYSENEKSSISEAVLSKLTKDEMVECLENLIKGLREAEVDELIKPNISAWMNVNVKKLKKEEIFEAYIMIKAEVERIHSILLHRESSCQSEKKYTIPPIKYSMPPTPKETYSMPPIPKKKR